MEQLVRSLKVVAIDDRGKETLASLSEEPLHRWTDPTRDFDGGALWVWRASGRPVAVVGVELYAMWSLEFVSVSTGIVRSDNGLVQWKPQKAGVEFQEIPEAPAPASTEAGRLRQMHATRPGVSRRANTGSTAMANITHCGSSPIRSTAIRILPQGLSTADSSSVQTAPTPSHCS